MSTIRFRFSVNHQSGQASRPGSPEKANQVRGFARVVVNAVAFSYSEGLYEKLKTDIQSRLERDVQLELNRMAQLFMRGIVGVKGRGSRGILTPAAPISEAMRSVPQMSASIHGLTGDWTPRSPGYMSSQGKRGGAWFRRNFPSPLDALRSTNTWTGAFGGIRISIHKHHSLSGRDVAGRDFHNRLQGTKGGNAKLGIATIKVSAMSNISVNMLPTLGGAGLGEFGGDARSSGLLSMLGPQMANRLGGNRASVPFRPTIQPFLGYFLTRSLPNAVFARIEQGLQGRLKSRMFDPGSAGRAQGTVRSAAQAATMQKPRR